MKMLKKFLTIGNGPDCNTIRIPYYVSNNSDAAKRTVYIQGGMHGGEITIWIIYELLERIKQLDTTHKTRFIIVPLANPIAWRQRLYFNTAGKFSTYDGKDWNRMFPGTADGSLAQRISHQLFRLVKQSDLAIDLHTSRKSFPFAITMGSTDTHMLKSINMAYTLVLSEEQKKTMYKGTLLYACCAERIPSVTYECGSHDDYNAHDIQTVLDSINNLVGLSKNQSRHKARYIYFSTKTYKAQYGGFIMPMKTIRSKYNKGDILFRILEPVETKIFDVVAEEQGTVQKISPTHIVWPGEDVYECIPSSELQSIFPE